LGLGNGEGMEKVAIGGSKSLCKYQNRALKERELWGYVLRALGSEK